MVTLIRSDLEFILQQIIAAESGTQPTDPLLPFGLRTVDGSNNNLIEGQTNFGAADQVFPRMTDPFFRTAEAGTSFAQTSGDVTNSRPRTISNLIVDQTATNPSAVAVADGATPDADGTLFIPNTTPDGGASASFNSWFTLFGQFFDHGLDLVNKGGNGTIFIPLQTDDPLFVEGSPTNFMVLTRATDLPGPDGVVGTADDIHEQVNQTTPLVDQNQTYTSHPSHQVFLREYAIDASGKPQATGRLLENRDPGSDGEYFTSDDVLLGGLATWAVVKANAATFLGIGLTDEDAADLPLLATDPYGQFLRGPNGFAQFVTPTTRLWRATARPPSVPPVRFAPATPFSTTSPTAPSRAAPTAPCWRPTPTALPVSMMGS